jgi:hypothetical protein
MQLFNALLDPDSLYQLNRVFDPQHRVLMPAYLIEGYLCILWSYFENRGGSLGVRKQ